MSLSQSQFTLRQWAEFVLLCAMFFVMMRMSNIAAMAYLLSTLTGSGVRRARENPDDLAGILYRFLAILGLGVACFLYSCFSPDPKAASDLGAILISFPLCLLILAVCLLQSDRTRGWLRGLAFPGTRRAVHVRSS